MRKLVVSLAAAAVIAGGVPAASAQAPPQRPGQYIIECFFDSLVQLISGELEPRDFGAIVRECVMANRPGQDPGDEEPEA